MKTEVIQKIERLAAALRRFQEVLQECSDAIKAMPDGIDLEERCESGDPACGPVEHHDSEGVPLCKRCFDGLEIDGNGEAT
jgi:hypothetical protein